MTVWEAVLLGIVQGLTEFLPVSSSGHLVIGQSLLRITIPGIAFEVAVHVATLLSVVIVYRARLTGLLVGLVRNDPRAWGYVWLLCMATLPAGFVGVAFGDFVERIFEAPAVTGVGLLGTGVLLWTTRWTEPRAQSVDLSWRDALVIGAMQAVALVPGISRSGATVVAGLFRGVRGDRAAEFSFLMAIPAILGAAVLELPQLATGATGIPAPALIGGVVAAATTGVAAILLFVMLLRYHLFHHLGLYCWAVGILFLTYLLVQ